ncbi:MAG TPA: carboxyl transferase domain-containing protein [Solirubrobacterales bacterium]|nr:carboxyl transferase domain-containing protein [Solirubrobacterales bacterium]
MTGAPASGGLAEADASWTEELQEVARRRGIAAELGGGERQRLQHERGKLFVRERLDLLLDAESFREVGSIAGRASYDEEGALREFVPSALVVGSGAIEGRPVAVAADDYTIRGGAAEPDALEKMAYAEQFANEFQLPLIRLVESSGGSVRSVEAIGRTYVPLNPAWEWVVANLATVPVVSVALGACAGIAAARVVSSHYSVMVAGTAQVFAAGPPLVTQIGEQRTKEELGGVEVHTRNGVVCDAVASEEEAFERVRRFLSYLPSSCAELPPQRAATDPAERAEEWLATAIPRNLRKPYAIRPILEAVVDEGSMLELGRGFGRSVVTALARLEGRPIALLASDTHVGAGTMTAAGARKLESFVDLASTFHLPVVHLVDQPGFAIGLENERAGTMRAGVRALSAIHQTDVPWCSVILRRCYGVAGAGHANGARVQHRFAWPSGTWGSLRLEGGIQAAYRREIEAAEDPAAAEEAIRRRLASLGSPLRTAEAFWIEEIIDPRETRMRLCEFARLAYRKLSPGPRAWGYRG